MKVEGEDVETKGRGKGKGLKGNEKGRKSGREVKRRKIKG